MEEGSKEEGRKEERRKEEEGEEREEGKKEEEVPCVCSSLPLDFLPQLGPVSFL